jgi:hypothetical protein
MVGRQYIISFLFLTLYAVAILRPFTPYVNYYLNKEKIAEEKCVNKDKPELACDGKCYLKSQVIREQQEQDESPAVVNIDLEKYLFDTLSVLGYSLTQDFKSITKQNLIEFDLLSSNIEIPFPPPKV